MSAWRTKTWLRLKALIHRRAFDRDLDDEIDFHLAMRERKQQRLGLTADDARHATRRRFGNTTLLKEDAREMRTSLGLKRSGRMFAMRHARCARAPLFWR
jgi:hypothetical protein